MNNKCGDIDTIFIFTITVNILIATAINFFSDKTVYLYNYQFVVAEWYGLAIIFLMISYVLFFIIKNNLKKNFIFYQKKRLLISVLLGIFVLFGSMYPYFMGYSFLIIPVAIASNVLTSFLIMFNFFWRFLVVNFIFFGNIDKSFSKLKFRH